MDTEARLPWDEQCVGEGVEMEKVGSPVKTSGSAGKREKLGNS